jgi:hypothetical protein
VIAPHRRRTTTSQPAGQYQAGSDQRTSKRRNSQSAAM